MKGKEDDYLEAESCFYAIFRIAVLRLYSTDLILTLTPGHVGLLLVFSAAASFHLLSCIASA